MLSSFLEGGITPVLKEPLLSFKPSSFSLSLLAAPITALSLLLRLFASIFKAELELMEPFILSNLSTFIFRVLACIFPLFSAKEAFIPRLEAEILEPFWLETVLEPI